MSWESFASWFWNQWRRVKREGWKVSVAENGIRVNDQVCPRGVVHIKPISTVTALTTWPDWLITKRCSNRNNNKCQLVQKENNYSARFLLFAGDSVHFMMWRNIGGANDGPVSACGLSTRFWLILVPHVPWLHKYQLIQYLNIQSVLFSWLGQVVKF